MAPSHRTTRFPAGVHRFLVRSALLCGIVAALPAAASAQVTWLVPTGGEIWTAGTQHTIAWTGGDPTIFALIAQPVPAIAQYPILTNVPNTGFATWVIPANLPPGPYKLYLGFVGNETVYESQQFTVQAAPECLPSCQTVSFNMLASSPPVGVCANTAQDAVAYAQAFVQSQLADQCFGEYFLEPSSIVIDVTLLPMGVCYSGYSGPYVAEASGFGCCCPQPVPAKPVSWGVVKSRF